MTFSLRRLLLLVVLVLLTLGSAVVTTFAAEKTAAREICWSGWPVISLFIKDTCPPQANTNSAGNWSLLTPLTTFGDQMGIFFTTTQKQISQIIPTPQLSNQTDNQESESDSSPSRLPISNLVLTDEVQAAMAENPPTTTTIINPTLTAGDGISINEGIISNSDRGSSQIVLKHIQVEDQDTIKFGHNDDTLEIEAGSNISLSTNADDKKLTITASDPGDSFDNLHEVGGYIGIGTTSPSVALDVDGNARLSANNVLTLTADNSAGNISRLLTLKSTSKYDRPWVSHIDYTGRHAASFGVHHTNKEDDDVHKRWELKTAADPNGSNPSEMLTRFAIDYDTDLANIIFGDIATIGTHNDYGDRAIFVHNMKTSDGTQDINVGQWTSELGNSDSTVMSFDALTLADDSDAYIRFFRQTDTTGERKLVVLKGDATATETMTVDASTGLITTFADGEAIRAGSGANTAARMNFQSARAQVGYDGSSAVLQAGIDKSIKFNVNQSSFGQGTVMTIETDGDIGIGTTGPGAKLHVYSTSEAIEVGDGANTAAYINLQGNRTAVGYDGSYATLQGGTSKGIKLNVNNSSFGAGTAVTIESDGDVGFGIAPTLGPIHAANGAYLSTGGTWENNSDRNLKEAFEELDPEVILEKISQLEVTEWSYISEGSGVRHIGPIAQDFYSLFGVGNSNTSISTIDPAGVALVGIQGLQTRLSTISGRLADVEAQDGQALLASEVATLFDDQLADRGLTTKDDTLVFKVQATFEKFITFANNVIFAEQVTFSKIPLFSRDTAGEAIIRAGSDSVWVDFESSYPVPPQVSLTPNQALVSNPAPDSFFNQDIRYVVSEVTVSGFRISLNKPTEIDTGFSWIAVAVKEPRVSVSNELIAPVPGDEVLNEEETDTEPAPTPTATPTQNEADNNDNQASPSAKIQSS